MDILFASITLLGENVFIVWLVFLSSLRRHPMYRDVPVTLLPSADVSIPIITLYQRDC
jgi:hypothetical protein